MQCTDWMRMLTWAYWLIAATSAAASWILPWANNLSRHGKTRSKFASNSIQGISNLVVPKRYFEHFYFVGMTWSVVLIALLAFQVDVLYWFAEVLVADMLALCESNVDVRNVDLVGQDPTLLYTLILFAMHTLRRFLECKFVSVPSPDAKMHFFGYLIGMTFYIAVPWSLVVGSNIYLDPEDVQDPPSSSFITVSKFLFLAGSAFQFQSHSQLAALRKDRGTDSGYMIPHGGMFEYVSSPHYLFEIVLYSGLLLVNMHNIAVWIMFIFVCLTLGSSAVSSHRWYQEKFDSYPKSRKALLPFLF